MLKNNKKLFLFDLYNCAEIIQFSMRREIMYLNKFVTSQDLCFHF